MSDDYQKRVIDTYRAQTEKFWELLQIACYLAPGTWPIQILPYAEGPDKHDRRFMAVVSNGDDNVTAVAKTPGGAVALLIHYLLEGSVFPLTGEGGHYIVPDFEDTPAGKQYYALRAAVNDEALSADDCRARVKAILNGDYGGDK